MNFWKVVRRSNNRLWSSAVFKGVALVEYQPGRYVTSHLAEYGYGPLVFTDIKAASWFCAPKGSGTYEEIWEVECRYPMEMPPMLSADLADCKTVEDFLKLRDDVTQPPSLWLLHSAMFMEVKLLRKVYP